MKYKKEIYVALFVISGIVLLLVGISYLQGRSVLADTVIVHTKYNDVEGLTSGDKVLLNGYQVGQVIELDYQNGDNSIIVSYDIKDEVTVPADSKAELGALDVFGSMCIRIIPGKSGTPVSAGDMLAPLTKKGMIDEAKSAVLPLADDLGAALKDVKALTAEMKAATQDSAGRINNIVKNVEQTSGNLAVVSGQFRGTAARINELTDNINQLVQKYRESDQLDRMLKNSADLTDSLKNTSAELRALVQSTKSSTDEMNQLLTKVNRGDGTLGKLVNDPKIYDNLEKATADLDALLVDIQKNPGRYVNISVFGQKR